MRFYQKSAAFLLCLMVLGSATGCGEKTDVPETTQENIQTETTQVPETETERIRANLPERDFGGEDITFFARVYAGSWSAEDLFVKETTGEVINDALYERESCIEETYNVALELVESMNDDCQQQVETFVSAGEDAYHAIVVSAYNSASLSMGGMLTDLHTVENMDLSQKWWAQQLNDSMSIVGKQFYAAGDILIIDNKAERVFFFNKEIVEELNIPNPYELVRNDEWTIDAFIKCSEMAVLDLNGDGQMDRKDDQYGIMAQPNLGLALYIGAGQTVIGKDDTGTPYYHCGTEEALNTMIDISDKISGKKSISLSWDLTYSDEITDNVMYFMEGRALFAPECLLHLEDMRDSDVNVGILPPPKFYAEQDAYHCFADSYCINAVSIPVTNTETEKIGFILEAMAAESMNTLTPAYIETCLTSKYVQDEDSVEMLELVLESTVIDLGEIYMWNDIAYLLSDAMYEGSTIASTVSSNQKSVESSIQRTLDALTD